jgi:hypothetical protein
VTQFPVTKNGKAAAIFSLDDPYFYNPISPPVVIGVTAPDVGGTASSAVRGTGNLFITGELVDLFCYKIENPLYRKVGPINLSVAHNPQTSLLTSLLH